MSSTTKIVSRLRRGSRMPTGAPHPGLCRKGAKSTDLVKRLSCESYLLDVHRFSEVAQHLFGAAPARFVLVGVARLAADELLVFVCHGTAANPFAVLMNVDMIEFGHKLRWSGSH